VDEIWRWRFRDTELRYNQFWLQLIRYLARSRVGRTELRLDRQAPYRRGEPIKITVRFPDEAPLPEADLEVRVTAERRPLPAGGVTGEMETQTLTLARIQGSRGSYEGLLTRTPAGTYRFWLSAPAVTGSKPHAECRVLPPPGEMDRLQMNRADMERAAEMTQGRFYTIADADNFLADLPGGRRVTLNSPLPPRLIWNHWVIFLVLLGLLGSEWFLRKRRHLV
jgi:hypothetical protein